ncbi:MAG: prolyl oligopeptidase family serine peptidase [Chloroflexi bacterium]|nr:prolyl oligopeptidase family serine peptidase [Chloroflexota bacterium]MCI0820814.1 prolyl oligopeptidase family serine peptidase [Chloroflexota bacterium]
MASLAGPHRDPASGGPAASLVVMLHGVGASGNDLISLADRFAGALPDTAFHAPDAPSPYADAPAGRQWYARIPWDERADGVRKVEPVVNAFIDELLDGYGLDASRCVLLGFSQGSIVSIHTAPRRQAALGGVVALSGAMITGDTLEAEVASKPPFVLIHGTDDAVLPSAETEAAAAKLTAAGIPVAMHLLPGLAHGIDERGIAIATEFMQGVLRPSQ